ncbi:hypothetical protein Tco_0315812 [Tanacetum coccineum]
MYSKGHDEGKELSMGERNITEAEEIKSCTYGYHQLKQWRNFVFKTYIDSYNTLKTLCDEQMNQLGDQEDPNLPIVKLLEKREANKEAVKEKEQLQKTVDSWKDSSKNLWRLIDSGMSSNSKVGLGFEIKSNNEVLSFEEEMNFSVFKCSKEDSIGKPSYSRFTKTNDFKGVPHPLNGDYTPKPQEEIDDSFEGYLLENTSEHSFETESESLDEPKRWLKS